MFQSEADAHKDAATWHNNNRDNILPAPPTPPPPFLGHPLPTHSTRPLTSTPPPLPLPHDAEFRPCQLADILVILAVVAVNVVRLFLFK